MKIKNFMTAVFLTLILSAANFAQQTFRVGEEVEYKCSRSTGWCGGRIEAIQANILKAFRSCVPSSAAKASLKAVVSGLSGFDRVRI